MRKRNYLIIISFVIMFILSCKVKDSIDEMQKLRTIEKIEDYGALSDLFKISSEKSAGKRSNSL